ncbi:hypothetical protein V1477_018936 [Vespula maculifrons]|uniref:Uncharacterized protein n=1 Tax=Vespula maculifrons TaxID=7453 RepID=A0ABD2ASV2_VESMC
MSLTTFGTDNGANVPRGRGLFHCASGAAVATSGGGGGAAAGGGGDDGSSGIAREGPSEKEIERAVEGRQRDVPIRAVRLLSRLLMEHHEARNTELN